MIIIHINHTLFMAPSSSNFQFAKFANVYLNAARRIIFWAHFFEFAL